MPFFASSILLMNMMAETSASITEHEDKDPILEWRLTELFLIHIMRTLVHTSYLLL